MSASLAAHPRPGARVTLAGPAPHPQTAFHSHHVDKSRVPVEEGGVLVDDAPPTLWASGPAVRWINVSSAHESLQ